MQKGWGKNPSRLMGIRIDKSGAEETAILNIGKPKCLGLQRERKAEDVRDCLETELEPNRAQRSTSKVREKRGGGLAKERAEKDTTR